MLKYIFGRVIELRLEGQRKLSVWRSVKICSKIGQNLFKDRTTFVQSSVKIGNLLRWLLTNELKRNRWKVEQTEFLWRDRNPRSSPFPVRWPKCFPVSNLDEKNRADACTINPIKKILGFHSRWKNNAFRLQI